MYYCCRAHQKLDWREGHKFKCCAFKVQYSDTFGRHMIATRDIRQGEMILKERPAVIGPRVSTFPMCLGCNTKLEPTQMEDGKLDFYKCSSCQWPLCGKKCESSEWHKEECKLMTERKYKCSIKYEGQGKSEAAYCVIAPVRVLLLKRSNPQQYENIMNLESHLDERINTQLYLILKANLVTFVIQVLGLTEFDEESILRVASILDTNAFDVRPKGGQQRFRAIFVTASMMAHQCKPNTKHVFMGDESNFTLVATVPIAKGEMITTTYTQTLWGTLERRIHLRSAKCFDCDCLRCKDPTEFGTYLGSIYCAVCNGPGSEHSLNRGAKLVSLDPLNEVSPWKCEKCKHTIQSRQMIWGNNAIKQELETIDKGRPDIFENFIEKYKHTLHATNYHIVQAKYVLTQIYGNVKNYSLMDLTDAQLGKKIAYCQELLELAEQLEPGWSRFRGVLLLDLQAAMTLQTKRDYESDKITKSSAQESLVESMQLLQEATEILKVEPDMRSTLEQRLRDLACLLDNKDGTDEDELVSGLPI